MQGALLQGRIRTRIATFKGKKKKKKKKKGILKIKYNIFFHHPKKVVVYSLLVCLG
jgi:hypothetical protein